jgi:hypothetical protein
VKGPPQKRSRTLVAKPAKMASVDFLLYQSDDGQTRIEVRMVGETVWLNLNQMSELFGRDKSVISRHIANIFEEGELLPAAVVANYATTAADGKAYQVDHFSLDVIISVGYRVKSQRGTQFRIWATQRLREYLIKGFAMDDERLKAADGGRYFDELLARIRDIRSSEKVFWRKALEIYATSIDYDPSAEASQQFFATVQNKMHWAAHGHTAAEVITQRADAGRPHMGLTSWQGPRPRKTDAEVAKNYLAAGELDTLNRIVTLYLDFAELQAANRRAMTMADWMRKLDDFLRVSERDILTHAGEVSSEAALKKAHLEYEKYRQVLLNAPSAVEQHFAEAISKTKRLAKAKKKGEK